MRRLTYGAGNAPGALAAAEVDGDGRIDLAVASDRLVFLINLPPLARISVGEG